MRVLIIFTLLFVGAVHALQPSEWTENQAKTICALDLRRLYGDALEVVSVMGKQPHENNTTLVGLVASDNRPEVQGQQVTVGCIYKQDGSLVNIFFNSKIANWTAPEKRPPARAQGAYAPSTKASQNDRARVTAESPSNQPPAAPRAYVSSDPCRNDLQCWGKKHWPTASARCEPAVEKMAAYDFEWTDGILEAKFGRFVWIDKERAIVGYGGDRIKFQNGFGAWQYHIYICNYDTVSGKIVEVNVTPGRF